MRFSTLDLLMDRNSSSHPQECPREGGDVVMPLGMSWLEGMNCMGVCVCNMKATCTLSTTLKKSYSPMVPRARSQHARRKITVKQERSQ